MLAFAKGFGFAGAAGALIGLIIVSIIQPTTGGGVAVLIAIPILAFATLGGIVGAMRGNEDKEEDKKDSSKDNNESEDGGD